MTLPLASPCRRVTPVCAPAARRVWRRSFPFYCSVWFFQVLALSWAAYNYLMVYSVKLMLRPRVSFDAETGLMQCMPIWDEQSLACDLSTDSHASVGRARVGTDETGRLYDHGAVEQFAASHKVLMFVTGVLSRLLGEQGDVSDPHFRLFGRAGERGPDLLRRSIKYHVSR